MKRFRPLLVALSLALVSLSALPDRAHAHAGGHDHAPDEYLELYRALLHSIEESRTPPPPGSEIPYFYFGGSGQGDARYYYFSGDAVSRIVQAAIERDGREHEHGVECDGHAHDHEHGHEHGDCSHEHGAETGAEAPRAGARALQMARGWLRNLGRFGLELPSIAVEGMRQYGTSFVLYTLLTEAIEHVFIPHPAFCKILQGAYFSTAGTVCSFTRVARSGMIDPAGLAARLRAGYLAARMELHFKWSARKRAFRTDPRLNALQQGDYQKFIEEAGDEEAGFAREYLAGTLFWAETAPGLAGSIALGELPTREPGAGVGGQLRELARAEAPEQRLWMAFRLASLFQVFKDLLGEASTETILRSWPRPTIDPRPYARFGADYGRFLQAKAVLGSLGKLLDLYKSELFALASSEAESAPEATAERILALERLAEQGILPLLERAPGLGDLSATADEIRALGRETARLTRSLQILGRNPRACAWAFRPREPRQD